MMPRHFAVQRHAIEQLALPDLFPSSSTPPTRKPFPFFRLPRELRDRIYEEVGGQDIEFILEWLKPEQTQEAPNPDRLAKKDRRIGVKVWMYPLTPCLLVSKSFKVEYATEIRRHSTARILLPETDSKVRTFHWSKHQIHDMCRIMSWSLGVSSKLEIRLWNTVWNASRDKKFLERLYRVWFSRLDNVKIIEDHVLLPINDLDSAKAAITSERVTSGYQEPDIEGSNERRVPVTTRVFFAAPLASVSRTYRPTTADRKHYPLLHQQLPLQNMRDAIQDHPSNHIICEATPDGQDGFNLEAIPEFEEAVFDCEGVMMEAEDSFRERLERR